MIAFFIIPCYNFGMRTVSTYYRSKKLNYHFHHYLDTKDYTFESVTLDTHPVYEILYLVEGNVNYIVGSKHLRLSAGDLIVLNKKTPHIVEADLHNSNYERFTLMFDLDLFYNSDDSSFSEYILGNNTDTLVFQKSTTQTTNILQLMQKIENLVIENKEFLDIKLISATLLIAEQINNLVRHDMSAQMMVNPHVNSIIEYINNNIYTNISLSELSKHLYLSPYYVSHIFSRHMKTSLKNYINIRKIHLAEELIAKGIPPSTVSRQLGFEYYSTFFNLYKKILGKTPSE